MKIGFLLSISLLFGCSSLPSEVRGLVPEMSYSVKASSDPLGLISRGLQLVQSTVGQPCPTTNTDSTYSQSTKRGIDYKVDCTQ